MKSTVPFLFKALALFAFASALHVSTAAFGQTAPDTASAMPDSSATASDSTDTRLPKHKMQEILGVEGDMMNGVLSFSISRDDIGDVQTKQGMKLDSAFEIDGMADFQKLGPGEAFLNGCFPLKESEVQGFISALLTNGLVFQAFHQHFPSDPQVWFIHFRGTGDPLKLAKALRATVNTTGVSLPQTKPQNPTTTLDADKLAKILHGTAMVGEEGVVTVDVDRSDKIKIDGVDVDPGVNVSTNIEFKPGNGQQADVVVDFSMKTSETVPVINLMLNQLGWYQGCLYNQETGEHPQLYFDHMLKSGDAYQLAREIRSGLDLTAAK